MFCDIIPTEGILLRVVQVYPQLSTHMECFCALLASNLQAVLWYHTLSHTSPLLTSAVSETVDRQRESLSVQYMYGHNRSAMYWGTFLNTAVSTSPSVVQVLRGGIWILCPWVHLQITLVLWSIADLQGLLKCIQILESLLYIIPYPFLTYNRKKEGIATSTSQHFNKIK